MLESVIFESAEKMGEVSEFAPVFSFFFQNEKRPSASRLSIVQLGNEAMSLLISGINSMTPSAGGNSPRKYS